MQYVPFLDSAAERERVGRLRAEIKEFRSASDEVLATDSSRWPAEARTLLRRFMPKREAAIRVSDEVQALNRAAFIDQQRDADRDAVRDAASGLDGVRHGARHQPRDRLARVAARRVGSSGG